MKSSSAAEQKRNIISHSTYGAHSNDEITRTKYTAKRKNGLLLQRERMKLEDLHDISKIISCAAVDIKAVSDDIRNQLKNNNWVCPDIDSSRLNIL